MEYILYGSLPSPFVRRIRILMENLPFELREMNIYEGQGAVDLNKINPVNQIPVLVDEDKTIWDSRQIFYYLNQKHQLQQMDWKAENLLTAIDGAMNAAVALLLMKRSGINVEEPFMYVQRQKERIDSVLDYLKPFVAGSGKKVWNFQVNSLYCFLDWAQYRNIISLQARPECQQFMDSHSQRPLILQTAIPKV
jgi:glutathione S-transferase